MLLLPTDKKGNFKFNSVISADQPASLDMNFVMRKPSERPAVPELAFPGFDYPQPGNEARWFNGFAAMLEGLPTTIMVKCAGDSDLLESKD